MKRLAILVSISLVIGMSLLCGCEKQSKVEIEEVYTTESNQSNWEEEFDKVEEEINQTRLEQDIELEIYKLDVGVDHEVSKQMMIDCLVDYCGYDAETVNKVIDNIKGIDWEYNCLVSYRKLLEEGYNEELIIKMLREIDFTEAEVQYAIDNH